MSIQNQDLILAIDQKYKYLIFKELIN